MDFNHVGTADFMLPVAASTTPIPSEIRVPTEPPLSVSEVTTEAQFIAARAEWSWLADQLTVASPVASWEWNWLWWKKYGSNKKLKITLFHEGTEPVGVAQYYQRIHGFAQLGPGSLVPIGWEHGKRTKGPTEQIQLIFPSAKRHRLFAALCEWLRQTSWAAALLPGIRESDVLSGWVSDKVVYRSDQISHHYMHLPGSWDAFLKSLSKSTRDNVKYYPRLLSRHGNTFSFMVAQTPEEISAELPVLFELHRARTQARVRIPHTDDFKAAKRRALLKEVAPLLAARHQIKLGLLQVNGVTVAAQMWFEKNHTMFISHSGYLPAWAKYSVSLITICEAFRHAMGYGVQRVEFFRGTGIVTERWTSARYSDSDLILGRMPAVIKTALAIRNRRRRIQRALGWSGPLA